MKENGFALEKTRSRRYFAQTITVFDFTDDLALLANTPALAESLLHGLERAAGGIELHMDTNKTEYVCLNQRGDVSKQNGGSLKLVDRFTYLGSSVSSNENVINTW